MNASRPWMSATLSVLVLAAGLSVAGLACTGCDKIQQQLSGARDQRAALLSLRQTLAGKRARLSDAVISGNPDFVPGYLNEMSTTLDSLETQAGKMSLMDGQEMKLKVASARTIVKAAEPFVMQNDMDGVKAQQEKLDQVLFEIDGVLERAINMTDAAPTGGGS